MGVTHNLDHSAPACVLPAGSLLSQAYDALLSPWLAVPLLLLLGGLLHGAPKQIYGHDEFVQRLMADTFAHGRLTNPPHPLWVFFESFHVLQQPSYMGKYPPGPALFMALGQTLFGHPAAGVCLAAACAALAVWWMLLGFASRPWALFGSILYILHPLVRTGSSDYLGWPVAALGAALLIGSLPRLFRHPRIRDGLLLGFALALLANSRPSEGCALAIAASLAALAWLRTAPLLLGPFLRRAVFPAAGVLTIAGCWMLYYNHRVTGHALQMPFALYEKQYSFTPIFAWQSPQPPPHYNHAVIENFQRVWAHKFFISCWDFGAFTADRWCRLTWIAEDYLLLGTLLIPALVCVLFAARDPRARFLVLVLLAVLLWQLGETFYHPHYLAPAMPLLILLAVIGLQHLRIRLGRPGPIVSAALGTLILLAPIRQTHGQGFWIGATTSAPPRNQVLAQLNDGQSHLVFLQYGPGAVGQEDWLYNEPDVDRGRIVWARDMGPTRNAELISYYPRRKPWLCQVATFRLTPCPDLPVRP